MNYLKKYISKNGFNIVVSEKENGLKRAMFNLLKLNKGDSYENTTGSCEFAFIILSGSCSLKGDSFSFQNIGKRKNVFSGKATAVYLPINTSFTVESLDDGLEIGICQAESKLKSKPILVPPEDVKEFNLGVLNWERKAAFIIDERVESENLFIGETWLKPGKWTFPPHRHDYDNFPEEVEMDEIYHYRINPENGFGIQLLYTDDKSIDNAYTVRNGDTITFPEGYHPAGASPVDGLYILWFLAGKKRYFLSRPEDQYKWIKYCDNLF